MKDGTLLEENPERCRCRCVMDWPTNSGQEKVERDGEEEDEKDTGLGKYLRPPLGEKVTERNASKVERLTFVHECEVCKKVCMSRGCMKSRQTERPLTETDAGGFSVKKPTSKTRERCAWARVMERR